MFARFTEEEYQKGQVLLIIVLVMIVALSIGLSVVTRSITNLQISSEEESSQRALSAAEAGIERALQSDQGISGAIPLDNNSQIDEVTLDTLSGHEFLVNNGNLVLKDDGADIWLSTYDEDNPANRYQEPLFDQPVSIYWGNPNDSCSDNSTAALEILLITKNGNGAAQIQHYPIDPCPSRATTNNFCEENDSSDACPRVDSHNPGRELGGQRFSYSTTFSVDNGVMIRVVPLYAPSTIGVATLPASEGGRAFPSQGSVIESLGTSGNTQRKLSVYKGFSKIPTEFFPYVLFAPNRPQ